MLTRNDQPAGFPLSFATASNQDFAVDSVFTYPGNQHASTIPPGANNYLLLDGTQYLLLDGTAYTLL